MLAVTHLTPVVGVDVHLIQTPAGVVMPLPHPHVGFVLDPMEYLSTLPEGVGSMVSMGMAAMSAGAIVKLGMRSVSAAAVAMAAAVTAGGGGGPIWINGLMRSTAGTQTMHLPGLHFPIGGVFTGSDAPKPAGNGEAFLGSMTVQANGDPMAYAVLPALTCWFAGMLSLSHNSEHTRRGSMSLPTSVMLPIPASRPVLVGGPPVPSIAALAGMAMRAVFSHGLSKPSRACHVSRAIQDRVGNGRWGNFVSLVARWVFGEPVNGITGEVVVQQHDFTVPGRLPLVWNRRYASHDTRLGAVGCGWQSPADIRIELFEHDGGIGSIVCFPDKWVCFDQMPADEGWGARIIEGVGGYALYLDGTRLIMRSREGIEHRFAMPEQWREQALAASPQQPLQSWLTQFNDLNGNAWRIELPSEGALRFIEWSGDAATGRIVHCAPGDLPGCIGRVTLHDAQGQRWPLVRYEQNARSDLIAVHDALDKPYHFEYAGEHVMVRHTDRNGLSFYYSHQWHEDGLWRVDHAWGDGGLYDYRFDYDLTYRETRITDSLGGLMRLQCDQRGLPVMLIDQLDGMSSYRYDGLGRTVAAVDPAGNRTTWEYDLCGNLLTHTLPDRSATRTEYDDNLRPIAITDPEGGQWKQTWDTRGNLVAQTTPSGLVTAFAYDPRGQLIRVRNAAQQVTTLDYDPLGYLVGLTDPLGRTTRLKHDARGKLIERQSPGEEAATYKWDAKGRLTACMLPGYRLVYCEYDAENNLTQYTDEAGHITRFSFFGQGQLASRIDANGSVTHYRYNTEEQLVGVINARGETWHLKRDAVGRLIEEIGYDKRLRRYAYDPAGHLTQSIDPLGQVLTVTCDPLGRITRRAVEGSDQSEAFAYDKRGRLIRASNANGIVKRAYDLDGQLLMELQQHVDATGTLAYAYDGAGRLTEQTRKLQTADSVFEQTLTYTYDALGAPQSIQIDDNAPIRFTRNIAGRLARTQFTGSLEHVYEYDHAGRLARHATRRAVHDDDTHFRYDISGNLIERRDSRSGSDQFSYDPLGRIVAHTDPIGRLKYFAYDAHGDRFKVVRDDDRGRELQHNDGARWLLDAAGQLVIRQGGGHGVQRFEWDAFGRLVGFENTHNERWAYRYDALGRRLNKRATEARLGVHSQQGAQTWFLWDGDALAGELRRAASKPDSARFYAYHLGSFEPLAMQTKDTASKRLYFYQNDPNGAPVRLRNTNGEIVWEVHYGVTGQVDHVGTERIEQPIRLQGQYEDHESGLRYNRHRYFDPQTASFVSQDPIGLSGGINPYQYAPNTFSWADPFGLTSCSVKQEHLDELAANGVKFSPENVVATGRMQNGKIVFLESGSSSAGLQHIVDAHGTHFLDRGITEAQIPGAVMQAVTNGKVVGYQGRGTGRPIYQTTINGETQNIAVTVGGNGFIVGANPASLK